MTVANRNLIARMYDKLNRMRNLAKSKKYIFECQNKAKKAVLKVAEDTLITPGHQMSVRVCSEHSKLQNKIWFQEPSKFFRKHKCLELFASICDGNDPWIPIHNFSTENYMLKRGSIIGYAEEAQYKELPQMNSPIFAEFASLQISSTTEVNNNQTPKGKSILEFENALKQLSAEDAEFVREHKDNFIPSHEWELNALNLPEIELGTQNDHLVETPPQPRRVHKQRDEEDIDKFMELGLLTGLIEKSQSPCASPMHVVRTLGKAPRIVLDQRLQNKMNAAAYQLPFPTIKDEVQELASFEGDCFFSSDAASAFKGPSTTTFLSP